MPKPSDRMTATLRVGVLTSERTAYRRSWMSVIARSPRVRHADVWPSLRRKDPRRGSSWERVEELAAARHERWLPHVTAFEHVNVDRCPGGSQDCEIGRLLRLGVPKVLGAAPNQDPRKRSRERGDVRRHITGQQDGAGG